MNEYIDQYKEFYRTVEYGNNDPVMKYSKEILRFLAQTNSKSLLDYGCGEGHQYKKFKLDEFWDLEELYCYDPALEEYENRPTKKYDAVINTDVLEHIPEVYLDEVVSDIFSFAENLVYFSICTCRAKTILPNGENAHCTLKSHEEWTEILKEYRSTNQVLVVRTAGKISTDITVFN